MILPEKIIRQAVMLAVVSAVIGLAANAVNPRGIPIRLEPQVEVGGIALADLTPDQTPPVIGTEQVRQLLLRQGALLIDARHRDEFFTSHIPGAQNIPFDELYANLDKINALPREPWLICYCDGPPCDLSHLLAGELVRMGFVRVAIYDAGMDAWRKSLPVATGEEPRHE